MRILLVEDDAALAAALRRALGLDLHTLDHVGRLSDATTALLVTAYDLLVLDLGLPDGDGVAFIQDARRYHAGLPIVVISARDQIGQRIAALDQGADDYLVKPFDIDELRARVRAAGRRRMPLTEMRVRIGEVGIDLARRDVQGPDGPITLLGREFQVLAVLLERRGRVVSRRELEEATIGWDQEIGSNTIEVHIHHLRRKLGAGMIQTVRRFGYVIPA